MNLNNIETLICTNGNSATRPALQYGIWVAELLKLPVHLLGITEKPGLTVRVVKLINEAIKDLESRKIPYSVTYDQGRASVVIGRYAHQGRNITVAGPFGRPIWRRYIQGRTFRRLMSQVESPIIYVPEVKIPLKHILLCTGGLAYSASAAQWVVILAKASQAKITLMHVVEPATLDYPVAQKLHENWQDIIHTDTPQARNIKAILADCMQAGIEHDLKLSHGNAIQEITREIRQSSYDLVGMGSMYSAQGLRHLYMPNVTAEVAETCGLPVITVRARNELSG